jgi:hypothetical protein
MRADDQQAQHLLVIRRNLRVRAFKESNQALKLVRDAVEAVTVPAVKGKHVCVEALQLALCTFMSRHHPF